MHLGTLPYDAHFTAQFIDRMDNLDIFSICQINHQKDIRYATRETNRQIAKLEDFKSWISSLEVMGTKRSLP